MVKTLDYIFKKQADWKYEHFPNYVKCDITLSALISKFVKFAVLLTTQFFNIFIFHHYGFLTMIVWGLISNTD